jgi:hypothetical protein
VQAPKDLIVLFDPDNGPTVVAVLDFIEELFFLIDLINSADPDGNLMLNFGHLVLAGNTENYGDFVDSDKIIDLQFGDLRSVDKIELDQTKLNKLANAKPDFSSPPPSSTQRFTSGVTEPGAINFHIFEPETIFKLILGQPDVTLFTAQLPTFGFDFFFRQEVPIVGPLVGFFSGGVKGSVATTIGLDTRGFEQFAASENPVHLLNSFFIDVSGDPFLTLGATIAVGAGVSLGPAKFGAEGGIDATIFFEFADLDGDDKVRINEMAANLAANSFNPLAIFDISGKLEFFLRAFIEINLLFFKLEESFEFVRLTLFEFNIPFERPAVLASQSGDTLTLNIGPNAADRLQGDTRDIGEEIFVKSVGPNSVVVWSPQFGVTESTADAGGALSFYRFDNVSTIIADGGQGNDRIDLSRVTHSGINAIVRGGPGNDVIRGTHNDDELFGGTGNNTIFGTGGDNQIFGGPGRDTIHAGTGNDTIFSGAGNDTINLTLGGNNIVDPGPGDNIITSGPGQDTFELASFGSVMTIDAAGSDVLSLEGSFENVTYFINGSEIFIGTDRLASLPSLEDGFVVGDHFTDELFGSRIYVANAQNVTDIIGGESADVFHVFSTASNLNLDGGNSEDKYIFWHGFGTINVTVDDSSNGACEEIPFGRFLFGSNRDSLLLSDCCRRREPWGWGRGC